jgi:hypothetical protein
MLILLQTVIFVGAVLAGGGIAAEPGKTYFVNPSGDDGNTGLSEKRAWRTLDRLEKQTFHQGDRILLAAGATFKGNMVLHGRGTSASPIVVESIGHAATIQNGSGIGLTLNDGGFLVRNLRFQGGAAKGVKGHHGMALLAVGESGTKYHSVRVENVEIGHYGDSGFVMGSSSERGCGFVDVLLRNVRSHDNFGSGITSYDRASTLSQGYSHANLLVEDCVAEGNHSGTGIVISGVDGCIIRRCRCKGNVGPGGGVGLWAYCAKDLRIEQCISSGTRSGQGDGGGFDLDGGCVNCVIEHCLSFDNDGPGYMHCDYPTAPPTRNNVIRNCISVNDGRKPRGDNVGVGFVSWGSGLDDCTVEGNRIYVTGDAYPKKGVGALFVTFIHGSEGKGDRVHVQSCIFKNNLVQVLNGSVAFVDSNAPAADADGTKFEGNAYFGESPGFNWAQKTFDLRSWREEGRDRSPVAHGIPALEDFRSLEPGQLP